MKMNELIAAFPNQLRESLSLAQTYQLQKPKNEIHNIVVAGLGGSGIGADITAELTSTCRKVPMLTVKGYELPQFVGKNTLLLCSSFSGNTEETLDCFEQGRLAGAHIICISSGGKLLEYAQQYGFDFVQLPGRGLPPRACLGYSLVQQIQVLWQLGMISKNILEDLPNAISLLENESSTIQMKAKKIASFLIAKFPVIYSVDQIGATAVRLRQQLNENAKILCSHHVIPEMNHNELVGWRNQPGSFAVLLLRRPNDHGRNQVRIDINKKIISQYTDTIIEIFAKGETELEQFLYLILIGDWISWELSVLREVDAVEVDVIDYLKSSLSNQ
jgi:glucose/mannose-6-phosphate isomerase